mmetsp:Transcript_9741/g.17161  ORF Transcript_9741/g.17161 Transcript_9741/m.17161 type:complete len:142 (-) Transcript_9741:91-516(-)
MAQLFTRSLHALSRRSLAVSLCESGEIVASASVLEPILKWSGCTSPLRIGTLPLEWSARKRHYLTAVDPPGVAQLHVINSSKTIFDFQRYKQQLLQGEINCAMAPRYSCASCTAVQAAELSVTLSVQGSLLPTCTQLMGRT